MGDYSYSEIGMLAGTAIGGVLAVVGISLTGNLLFLLLASIPIAAGILVGNAFERRRAG